MKLAFQGNHGKLVLTADNLKFACHELGISDDKHTLRRTARAFDLYHNNKVEHINDHTFSVASQYDRQRPYQVKIHPPLPLPRGEGATKLYGYCTCQDWMNYSGDMDVPNVDFWCKHMISAALWLHNNGNLTSIKNECGTDEAKAIQAKLNGQIDSRGNNGAHKAPSQMQLDISDPFQECELKDIAQVEGRSNGELVHKLSNGEYVVSYRGIMSLAERHNIEFSVSLHDDTNTVIAYARRNDNRSERVSGKPVRISGSVLTATELAKRNSARQLIPYAEQLALVKKFQLEAEFDWQKAKAKCVELVGDANVSIIIHDLTQAGKLRQDNPSHYDRTEWLVIFNACQKDAQVERDPKSLNRWSYNSVEFIAKCKDAIAKVREEDVGLSPTITTKSIEANELPSQSADGKRRLDPRLCSRQHTGRVSNVVFADFSRQAPEIL